MRRPLWERVLTHVVLVIASIIAVTFGVIFWAWGLLWNGPADAIPLPGRASRLPRSSMISAPWTELYSSKPSSTRSASPARRSAA